MATYSTTLKQFIVTASADADFRAVIGKWRDAFTAFGWVQTADTGQINPVTVTFPGSNNTIAGTEIWRFDDALQSTTPVYMKIGYGRGGGANDWRITFQVSLGSTDGAQTFTAFVTSDATIKNFATNGTRTVTDTTAYRIDGSGGTGRGVLAWYHNTASTPRGSLFLVERVKNSDGTDSAEGVIAILGQMFDSSGGTIAGLLLDKAQTHTPAWRPYNHGIFGSPLSPIAGASGTPQVGLTVRSNLDAGSSLHQGKIYGYPYTPGHPGWRYPQMGLLQYIAADFPVDYSTVAFSFYGADHTYLPLGPTSGFPAPPSMVHYPILVRYE